MSEAPFLARLPGSFAWPLTGRVRPVLVAGLALGLGFLRWLPWSTPGLQARRGAGVVIFAFAFLVACGVSWLFGIVRRTTHPDDLRPESFAAEIDKDDAWEDLLQFLGAFAVAYLPLLGFLGYALAQDGRPFGEREFQVALATTAVAGSAYFPMALLLLGYTGQWQAAFNVPLGLRGMGRLGAGYAVVVALFLAAAGLACLLEVGWAGRTAALTTDGWIARTSTSLVELYLAAVAMRALGLLYVARGGRLGWVSREET